MNETNQVNPGCFWAIVFALAVDAVIAGIVILFIKGKWELALIVIGSAVASGILAYLLTRTKRRGKK